MLPFSWAEYRSFFYSQSGTVSIVPDADRLRSMINFFNRNDLIGDGLDPFVVDGVTVERFRLP